MTKKLRVILTVATVELMLGRLWRYLAEMRAMQHDQASVAAQATIGSTMGTAMGAFLGFGCLMMLMAAKNDRNARG